LRIPAVLLGVLAMAAVADTVHPHRRPSELGWGSDGIQSTHA
jgi:hypothetical protein